MSKATFTVAGPIDLPLMQVVARAAKTIIDSGRDAVITVAEKVDKRSSQQNRLMWELLGQIAQRKQWPVDGRLQWLEPEEWKDILSAGLKRHQRVAMGIEGGFVILGQRTSRMSVQEMTDLIELIYAFAAEQGVELDAERAA